MFDEKGLEHFLDGLGFGTHFPRGAPNLVVEAPPRSALDSKMDKYDLKRLAGEDYENAGTSEFPLLVPPPTARSFFQAAMHAYNVPMWPTPQYAPLQYTSGIDASSVTSDRVETTRSCFKAKVARLAEIPAARVPGPVLLDASTRAPDYTHTITAWRGWEYKHGMLESLGLSSMWEPRRAPQAVCRSGLNHLAPYLGCQCGYWSFKTREGLTEALATYAAVVDVIGQVEIWGRVVECENGWRSEYAYPKELWLLDKGLESVSWRYGVPVRRLS